jgi:hypothetical protein
MGLLLNQGTSGQLAEVYTVNLQVNSKILSSSAQNLIDDFFAASRFRHPPLVTQSTAYRIVLETGAALHRSSGKPEDTIESWDKDACIASVKSDILVVGRRA